MKRRWAKRISSFYKLTYEEYRASNRAINEKTLATIYIGVMKEAMRSGRILPSTVLHSMISLGFEKEVKIYLRKRSLRRSIRRSERKKV